MYNWRAIIGRVEPGMWGPPEAYEWLQVLPKNIALMITVSGLQNLTLEEMDKARSNIADSVRKLDAEGVDVIDVGGSPVLGYKGYNEYKNFLASLKKITKVPLVTALTAEFDALRESGIERVAVATPYTDAVSRNRKELLEENGFKIMSIKGAGLQAMKEINRLPEDASYRLAKAAYEQAPQADGIYICCPAWPVVNNIEKLEKEFNKPVVTNVQAQVWACFCAAGIKAKIKGYGKLLASI